MNKKAFEKEGPASWFSAAAFDFADGVAAISTNGFGQARAAAAAQGFAADIESLMAEICIQSDDRLGQFGELIAGDRVRIEALIRNFRTDAALGVARLPRVDDTSIALQLFEMDDHDRAAFGYSLSQYVPVKTEEREGFVDAMLDLCVPKEGIPAPDGGVTKIEMIRILVELAKLFPEKTRRVIEAINKLTSLDLENNPDGNGGYDKSGHGCQCPGCGDGHEGGPDGSGTKKLNCGDRIVVTGKGRAPTIPEAVKAAQDDADRQASLLCPRNCPARIVNPPTPRPSVGPKKNGTFTATVTATYECR